MFRKSKVQKVLNEIDALGAKNKGPDIAQDLEKFLKTRDKSGVAEAKGDVTRLFKVPASSAKLPPVIRTELQSLKDKPGMVGNIAMRVFEYQEKGVDPKLTDEEELFFLAHDAFTKVRAGMRV